MIQERTIAISEEQALWYAAQLSPNAEWWNEESTGKLATKFGADIEVIIVLHRGMHPRIEATFHVNKELVYTTEVNKDILGTYVFNMLDTQYQVHIRTIETIEKEEKRRVKQLDSFFIPETRISDEQSNNNLRKRYWLFQWDECYPSGGLEQVTLKFDTEEELEGWFGSLGDYLPEHAQVLDIVTGVSYSSKDMRIKPFETEEELKAWFYSLPIVF